MTANRYNQTVDAPSWDVGNADPWHRPATVHVVMGDNKPLPKGNTLLGFTFLMVPIVILGVALKLTGLQLVFVLIFVGVLSLPIGYLSLIVGSGDITVMREQKLEHKRELLRMEHIAILEATKIEAKKEVELWLHERETKRITVDGEIHALRAELRVLTDRQHVGPQPNGGVSSPSFVPPRVGRVERMVSDFFVRALWQRGELNPAIVDPTTGKFVCQVPWSSRGAWNAADTREATAIMLEPGAGAPPLVVRKQGDNGYYLNLDAYASKGDIINVLGIV